MILVLFLCFLYATIFVIGKFAIQVSQPIFLTGVRMVCAGVISYSLHLIARPSKISAGIKRSDWLLIILLAIFNIYITNAGEFWSLQYLSAGKTSFIYNLSPFFILIISALLFHERITLTKCIGMMIGFCALAPMFITPGEVIDTTYHFGWLSVAEIVMLRSAGATALGWVLMKYLVHHRQFTPYFLNGVSLILGGVLCLVHAYMFEVRPMIMSDGLSEFFIYMVSMMLIQNVVAYNLHGHLLRYHSATLVSLFSFTMPLMTVLMGNVLLDEPITMLFFLCSFGVAVGLVVFYQEEFKIRL